MAYKPHRSKILFAYAKFVNKNFVNTKKNFLGPPENKNVWERLWVVIEDCAKGKHTVFAEKMGVPGGTFQPFATGERLPNPNILISIHKTYGVDITWLLTGKGNSRRTDNNFLDNIDMSKLRSKDFQEELSLEETTLLLKVLLEDREDHRKRIEILENYIEHLKELLDKNKIEYVPLLKRSGTES